MSIRVSTLVWRAFPGNGSALLVMLALADFCNDEGGSLWPSIRTIAQRIRTSESQARRVMHKLIGEGWLCVVANERGGAPGATRHYRLDVSKLQATGSMGATRRFNETPSTHARNESHRYATRGCTGASQTISRSIKYFEDEETRKRAGTLDNSKAHIASIQEILRRGV